MITIGERRDMMIEAIAKDAYDGATERELRQLFIEVVSQNIRGLPDSEIERWFADIEQED